MSGTNKMSFIKTMGQSLSHIALSMKIKSYEMKWSFAMKKNQLVPVGIILLVPKVKTGF